MLLGTSADLKDMRRNLRDPPDHWRHDMKNQLGIILGFATLLLEDMEPGNLHRLDIEQIRAAAERTLELLAQLPPEEEGS